MVSAEDKDAAEDDEEAKQVAIKKIERAFEHPLFAKRTLRELIILRLLSHENVLPQLVLFSLGGWIEDYPETREL